MSVSGRSAITTAAAWIEELRTMPSRPWRVVDHLVASGSGRRRARAPPRLRQSSNDGGRPMIGSGISFASRSPVP